MEIVSEDINLAADGDEVALDFTAQWTTESPPGEQQCLLQATGSDGNAESYAFTLGSGDGNSSELLLPASYADSTNPTITCSPIPAGGVSK